MQLIGPEPPLVHHRDIERYGELIIETVDMLEKSIAKKDDVNIQIEEEVKYI